MEMETLKKAVVYLKESGFCVTWFGPNELDRYLLFPYLLGPEGLVVTKNDIELILGNVDAFICRENNVTAECLRLWRRWRDEDYQCTGRRRDGNRCNASALHPQTCLSEFRIGQSDRCVHHQEILAEAAN